MFSILWQRYDPPGHDFCRLMALEEGWQLLGTAVFSHTGSPCQANYCAECDPFWRSRKACVTGWLDSKAFRFEIVADGDRWLLNGED